MNRGLIALLSWFSLTAVSISVTGAQSGAGAAPPLTYVTFNLFHGGPLSGLMGDGQNLDHRLRLAAEELRDLHADIVGLQEATTIRQRGNVAARLASQLGLHHVYGQASSRFFGGNGIDRVVAALLNFGEGPAILSRYPILAWEVHDLPRCGRFMDSRVLLSATVRTPWGLLRVFSTHTRGDSCQTRRVGELVREQRGPLPSVLMGDFNAVAGSPAITALTDDMGFVDAFRVANPTEPGPTVWQQVDAPGPTVKRRVDYLFVIPGLEFPGRVLSSRVVLNAPRLLPDGTALWPSDHYGVFMELEVFAPRAR
jgi:endonuclease/exonuclease/phosphatase family metal-dependent hydrolase